jgi:hypothetical protein
MGHIRENRSLDLAVPIVNNKEEIITINGQDVSNISRIRPMQPADADDPERSAWLHEFFTKIWDPAEPQQRDYFLAWFKRVYENSLGGHPVSGQGLVIAGPPGVGKTFLSWRIIGASVGGFSDGAAFLRGETGFNKEIAEVPLLAVDDSTIGNNAQKLDIFTANFKKFVADPSISYHRKGKDALRIPCHARIIVTCNTDGDSTGILPRLNESNEDKIMLLKTGEWKPNFNLTDGPEAYIKGILPYWLKWLLDWQPPDYVLSGDFRFGVKPYKHPALAGTIAAESREATLKHMIDAWYARRFSEWDGGYDPPPNAEWVTARQLRDHLRECPGVDQTALKTEMGGTRLGRALSNLGRDYVVNKSEDRVENCATYCVTTPQVEKIRERRLSKIEAQKECEET